MLRIQQLKLPCTHTEAELMEKIAKLLKIPKKEIKACTIVKKSIDARKEPVCFTYVLDVAVSGTAQEGKLLKKLGPAKATLAEKKEYRFPKPGTKKLMHPPVIVGTGPAGLFCGLMLARHGYAPILLERGACAARRKELVDLFWNTGALSGQTNVQFGEGGAGTFSDGKLNTLVKDPSGRNGQVLRMFVEAGAAPEILYWNKPHIGTDVLIHVVEHMREEIRALGGQVLFESQMTDIRIENGQVTGVTVNGERQIETEQLVLAIGHSARDTFALLKKLQVPMEQKAFAVGVRIEHPQELINEAQYHGHMRAELPAASYKVTRKVQGGNRGVYSFCMCPGGYVVNASSEKGYLAVNGMSYHARDGKNANSAMIVTVRPEDFGSSQVLAGVEFQRRLEKAAFAAGAGKVPVQLLCDFAKGRASTSLGAIEPCIKGAYTLSNVREIFPENLAEALTEGILSCDQLIKGFGRADAVLSGVESRTSSPVRILRDEGLQSSILGLYPCGEGAGYAGGITSAAMDGIKAAEAIAKAYAPIL